MQSSYYLILSTLIKGLLIFSSGFVEVRIKLDMSGGVAIWPFLGCVAIAVPGYAAIWPLWGNLFLMWQFGPYFISDALKNRESLNSRTWTIFRQSVIDILKI